MIFNKFSKQKETTIMIHKKEFLQVLELRFIENQHRHHGIAWKDIETLLISQPNTLSILEKMENTGGEPDLVILDSFSSELLYIDCAKESPSGRRSLCFDQIALNSRKENKPQGSAQDLAIEIGIELLSEKQYRDLQKLGEFDTKTSSWIKTPDAIRKKGGALFCDRRYGEVFVYHNGAESYYSGRGFRGFIKL
jgi:hypothetical protein